MVLDGGLGTVGLFDFHGTLRGSCAAHTKLDAATGELHAVAYDPTWDHVTHLVADRTARIPLAGAPTMHDFALTERHVVLFDVPIAFDAAAARAGDPLPYVWNDKHPPRVGVMAQEGGPGG